MDCRDVECRAHGRYLRRIARLQRAVARERAESHSRQASLGRAWSAYLNLLMDTQLDDGTPLLALLLERNPRLRELLDEFLRGTT